MQINQALTTRGQMLMQELAPSGQPEAGLTAGECSDSGGSLSRLHSSPKDV